MVYVIQLLKLQCGVWVKRTRNVWFAILKIPLLQELVDNIGQMVNFVPPMKFYYSCDFKSAFFIDQINSGLGQEPEIVNWLDIDHNHSQLLEWRKWRGIDWFTIQPKHKSIDNIGRMVNLALSSIGLDWSCGFELNIECWSGKLESEIASCFNMDQNWSLLFGMKEMERNWLIYNTTQNTNSLTTFESFCNRSLMIPPTETRRDQAKMIMVS
jgi:hypothetical protein